MPNPGDQHNIAANPYEDVRPRVSEYTAAEIATLQARLEKQLGPEYLSARAGPSGGKVHYITAEKCIALANEVFGFNGWSSSIQNIQVDFVDENPQTMKISLGLSVVVRVTLRDGTYHEDIGYGHIENCKGKAAAFEKAKKEGTTDALKRALRNFGNVLGNCIYDKDYLAKVTKMKVAPTRFDEGNLHRHPDFAKKGPEDRKPEIKVEGDRPPAAAPPPNLLSTESFDEDFGDFDMADFGVTEDGHPDEVVLAGPVTGANNVKPQALPPVPGANLPPQKSMQPPARTMTRSSSAGNLPKQPQTPGHQPQRPSVPAQGRPNPQPNRPPSNLSNVPTAAGVPSAALHDAQHNRINTPHPPNAAPSDGVGFFSARSLSQMPDDSAPSAAAIPPQSVKPFDPHVESPSIRKTPGIDHNSSKPVSRSGQHVPPTVREPETSRPSPGPAQGPARPQVPGRPGIGNPTLSQTRQIGAPGAVGSPLANRGQYKPPTMKRPAVAATEGNNRAALADVSTNGNVAAAVTGGANAAAGPDVKRQKVG